MSKKVPSVGFSFLRRLKSFGYALQGIGFALKTQHNAWLHLFATSLIGVIGWFFQVNAADWRWLIMCIALVWFAELINTAFEYLCDIIAPEFHISVKRAKDIAAGAVLVCAFGAAIIGITVFWPYFMVFH
jgi:diacylglycerol kinase (ATP)